MEGKTGTVLKLSLEVRSQYSHDKNFSSTSGVSWIFFFVLSNSITVGMVQCLKSSLLKVLLNLSVPYWRDIRGFQGGVDNYPRSIFHKPRFNIRFLLNHVFLFPFPENTCIWNDITCFWSRPGLYKQPQPSPNTLCLALSVFASTWSFFCVFLGQRLTWKNTYTVWRENVSVTFMQC